jgi:hypothetical protein
MRPVPSFVFPWASADQLLADFTEHLADYITDPTGATSPRLSPELKAQAADYAAQAGVVGIGQAPTFTLRQGTGQAGDEPVLGLAQFAFGDDDLPGVPYVRLILADLGTAEGWGDRVLQPVAFTVDSYADDFQGTLTTGVDAHDAGSALQGVVWRLLSPANPKIYKLLKTFGFCNSGVRASAPLREGIEFHRPFSFGYDAYYWQQ